MAAVKGQQGQAPGTVEGMQTLVLRHNGRCLSSTYRDTNTKLLWQCDQGHTWKSRRKLTKPARTLAPDINRNNLPIPHPRHDTR